METIIYLFIYLLGPVWIQQFCSVPFPHIIQMNLFLLLQNGEGHFFAAEMVAQRNGPVFTKQAGGGAY